MSLDSSRTIAPPRTITPPRPLHPAATALGRVLARTWSLPPVRNRVAVERDVQVPMPDGAVLLADH